MHREYYVLRLLASEASRLGRHLKRRIDREAARRPGGRHVEVVTVERRETARQAFLRASGGAANADAPESVLDQRCTARVTPPDGAAGRHCGAALVRNWRALRRCADFRDPERERVARLAHRRVDEAWDEVERQRRRHGGVDGARDETFAAYKKATEAQRLLARPLRRMSRELCRRYADRDHHLFRDGWRLTFVRRNVYDWDGHLRRAFPREHLRRVRRDVVRVR